MAALTASAAVVTALAYLMAGPHSLDQLNRASKSVSLATPWHLLAGAGGGLIVTYAMISAAAIAVVAALGPSFLHTLIAVSIVWWPFYARLVRGEVAGQENVLVRLHSECLTGDVLGSLRCDCGDQLVDQCLRGNI